MSGLWIHRPERDMWCLVIAGREQVRISGSALAEICTELGLSRRQALDWIATRPRQPWGKRAA